MPNPPHVHTLQDLQQGQALNSSHVDTPESGNNDNFAKGGATVPARDLPDPKEPPQSFEKQMPMKEFKEKNPKATHEEVAEHQAKLDGRQKWQDHRKLQNEVENFLIDEDEDDRDKPRDVFGGQDFLNKDEAADAWIAEVKMVIQTDAKPEMRQAAYDHLMAKTANDEELKAVCDLNLGRLLEWAKGDYQGDAPEMQYYDESGKVTNKRSSKADRWAKKKQRVDDVPEQDMPDAPSDHHVALIRNAWEKGDSLLKQVMNDPKLIRESAGAELRKINSDIAEQTKLYDLQIPAGIIVEMIVECTERLVRHRVSVEALDGDEAAVNALKFIKNYVERMNAYMEGPTQWEQGMHEALRLHKQNADAQNVQTVEQMHALPGFWTADLGDWIRKYYIASIPQSSTIPPQHLSGSSTDQQASGSNGTESEEAGPNSNATENAAPSGQATSTGEAASDANQGQPSVSAGQAAQTPKTQDTSMGQAAAHAEQGQPPAPAVQGRPKSKDWVTTGYYQCKDGVFRHVGGLRKQGLGYQVFLRMNDETETIAFWELTGGISKQADSERWIDNGGLLVGGYDKSLTKGIKAYSIFELTVTGIAVQPRKTGESYANRSMTLIHGSFSNKRFQDKEIPLSEEKKNFAVARFYPISALRNALGENIVEDWYTNLMNENSFRRPIEPNGQRFDGRPSKESTNLIRRERRKALRNAEKDISEGSEDITQENDEPVDRDAGEYADEGDDFIEPSSTDGIHALDLDEVSRMMDEKMNKRFADFETHSQSTLAKSMADLQESLQATIQATMQASMQTLAQGNRPVVQSQA